MINKLRKKFIAVSMISVLIVLLILIGSINLVNRYNIVRDADRILDVIAENGGTMPEPGDQEPPGMSDNESSEDTGSRPEPPDLPEGSDRGGPGDLRQIETIFDTRYFTVTFDENGSILSSDTSKVAAVDEDEAREIAGKIYKSGKERGFSGDYRFLRTAAAADASDNSDPDSTIVICVDCYRSMGNFRSFMLISAAISLVGYIAVFILLVILSGRVVKPVAESYEKQKQFISDASHELKTPLAVIDADVSVLEMELENTHGSADHAPEDTGSSEDRVPVKNEWLADIKVQTKRLAGLTEEMVYLSRMDEGRKPDRIPFPLSDVVSDEAESFAARAIVEEKTLTTDIESGISYEGDEKMIRELVSILLDNALKYSDEHGTISCMLRPSGQGALLTVTNTVGHIEKEQTDRMFDRFYRADSSRNEKSGYGLGLSIAKAVCESHGGSISASAPDEKHIIITAKLA